MAIEFKPIGIIHTPFSESVGMPIQPAGGERSQGHIEIFPEYQAGLKDLDGFSHLILLYVFDRSQGYDLEVIPFLDKKPHGVFATRAPRRPNPIGLSIVELEGVEDSRLLIRNLDILDGTPLLDIKPYVPTFDTPEIVRTGWLVNADDSVKGHRSDDRFSNKD